MSVKTIDNRINSGTWNSSYRLTQIEIQNIRERKFGKKAQEPTQKQLDWIEHKAEIFELLGLQLPLEHERRFRSQYAASCCIKAMNKILYDYKNKCKAIHRGEANETVFNEKGW